MEQIVIYLLMFTEIIKFKGRDSRIITYSLCLGNIWKDWTNDNMNQNRINGFSTDYDTIATLDILEIHKYLMKNNGIV